MTSVTIEPLTSLNDIDAVLAVETACFTNPWTRAMYVAEFDGRDVAHCLLARDAGAVIGFCSFWLIVDEIHINNLAVLPAYRRQGVATAILGRIFAEGRRLGAARTTLEVRRSNDIARRLYERFGFAVAGVRRGYYTNPSEDALILWRQGFPVDDA